MEKFTVYVTFPDNSQTTEEHDETTIGSALARLTRGPAASVGMIKEVKVVDMLDCTNFLWKEGRLEYPIPGVHY